MNANDPPPAPEEGGPSEELSSGAGEGPPPEPTKPMPAPEDSADQTWRIQFAQSCLDYTMRTSQLNEVRMTKLLTVTISALAFAAYLLREIVLEFSKAGSQDFLFGVFVTTVVAAAILLILGIFVLFKGITPMSIDQSSRIVNDYIAGIPRDDYVREMHAMSIEDSQKALFVENSAMARVVLARQATYKLSSTIFYCGGGLLVLGYFAYVIHSVISR